MNRNHRVSSGILIVVLLLAVFLIGCKSGGNKAPKEDLAVEIPKDNTAVYEDIKQAEKIFNALPSPLESAMLIKSPWISFTGYQYCLNVLTS